MNPHIYPAHNKQNGPGINCINPFILFLIQNTTTVTATKEPEAWPEKKL